MMDPDKMKEWCAGCRSLARREVSVAESVGGLDRYLRDLVEDLTEEIEVTDGDLGYRALRGLVGVATWVETMSTKFDYKLFGVVGSSGGFKDLLEGARYGRRFAPVEMGTQTEAYATVCDAVGDLPVEPANVTGGLRGAPSKCKGTQTEAQASVVGAATGGPPRSTAEVGVQATRVSGGASKVSRRRRRRRGSDARTSASTSPSSNSARRAGGGDMTAVGPPQVGGRKQRSIRGVRALAPLRSAAGGPSFAAVAASAGRIRPPTSLMAAGGVGGGGGG